MDDVSWISKLPLFFCLFPCVSWRLMSSTERERKTWKQYIMQRVKCRKLILKWNMMKVSVIQDDEGKIFLLRMQSKMNEEEMV